MEREIIRHSEGYWSLVDERGTVICRFKIGDKVRIKVKGFTQKEGEICAISFLKKGEIDIAFVSNSNDIFDKYYDFYTNDIEYMEVMK